MEQDELSLAEDQAPTAPVIGVLSGCGGAGASSLAAAVASAAARERRAFLIDCDPMGGGLDVLLGAEQVAGPRWRHVRLRGGQVTGAGLEEALPRWGEVAFLAADTADELPPEAVAGVIDAGRGYGPVVLDLPRWPSGARSVALQRCDAVLLVTVAEVRAVTSSALIAAGLDSSKAMVAVRGANRELRPSRIGAVLGLGVLGEIPFDPIFQRPGGLAGGRFRRSTVALAERVLDVARPGSVAA